MMEDLEKATFGAGCFWCTEAVFQRVDGVRSVVSGYAGGNNPKPTYDEVCSGSTGHAEVVQITYNPRETTYERLLDVFWKCHDPTSLNRQGADFGTQYRSVIFYHDERQREMAETSKREASKHFDMHIVTTIEPLTDFWKAEDYHQNYYNSGPDTVYCQLVIKPKLEKLKLTDTI